MTTNKNPKEKNESSRTQNRDKFIEIQIRVQCAKFAKKWGQSRSESSDKQSYWNDLFRAFGRNRESVAVFEKPAKTRLTPSGDGCIDVFWTGMLLVEHKSRGKDLDEALVQANGYFAELKGDDIPRYIVLCDFFKFILIDIDRNGERHEFTIEQLPDRIHLFKFMWEDGAKPIAPSIPVNIKASEKMGAIYDELHAANYSEEDMEYLLTRLTFCLFAEDVGIFNGNQFSNYVKNSLKHGATGLGPKLIELFDVLNKPKKNRMKTLDEDLEKFEYIDGGLFEHRIEIPSFTVKSSRLLQEAASYDWEKISPVIFGSLFQSVMNVNERRTLGAHYTSEENIMKVLHSLFLDELYEEFTAAIDNDSKLRAFHEKLAGLTFFDPACGAGNFLILAYREIRLLETELLYLLHGENQLLNIDGLSKIDVNQFYGIEINKFSSTIAQTAMWMMDHLMNVELGKKLGHTYARIPIEHSPHIVHGDALELEWNNVLPADECTYVLGNPPFGGVVYLTPLQRNQMKRFGRKLDYVCAWFIKAAKYIRNNTRIGFVATNSIIQGQHIGLFWPNIMRLGMRIIFAHTTFVWNSEAKGKAHVHVVIVGLGRNDIRKRLFVDGEETNPEHITPYLTGDNTPIICKAAKQLNGLPVITRGAEIGDNGNYILTQGEKDALVRNEPDLEQYLKKYVNAQLFINKKHFWIIMIEDMEANVQKSSPEVFKRIKKVKKWRLNYSAANKNLPPNKFAKHMVLNNDFLAIPRVSSKNRKYVPMGYVDTSYQPTDQLQVIENASLGLFGLLTSHMHMLWLYNVGGRLKSDFRYAKSLVYNTFPVPEGGMEILKKLEPYAHKILDARDKHSNSTYDDLYNDNTMPDDLRKAHEKLDKVVERLYCKEQFKSDQERLRFLFNRYGVMLSEHDKLKKDSKKIQAKKKPQS